MAKIQHPKVNAGNPIEVTVTMDAMIRFLSSERRAIATGDTTGVVEARVNFVKESFSKAAGFAAAVVDLELTIRDLSELAVALYEAAWKDHEAEEAAADWRQRR